MKGKWIFFALRGKILAILMVVVLIGYVPGASAADRYWVGQSSDDWAHDYNWYTEPTVPASPDPDKWGMPEAHDQVLLLNTEDGAPKTVYYAGGASQLGLLWIDNTQTLHQTDGELNTLQQNIGTDSTGVYRLSGGTNHIVKDAGVAHSGTLYLGHGGNGYYYLDGGELHVDEATLVGPSNHGVFEQQAGSTHTTTALSLGSNMYSNGTYDMYGGTVHVAGDELIGDAGAGNFTQIAGTHTIGGGLRIGDSETGAGGFMLHGGTLQSRYAIFGLSGEGGMYQGADSLYAVDENLYLGGWFSGSGDHTMVEDSDLRVTESIVLGWLEGSGTFEQNDDTTVSAGGLDIGSGSRTYGSYTLNNGTLDIGLTGTMPRRFDIGNGGQGTFIQAGGAVTSALDVHVATNTLSEGTLMVSDGTFSTNGLLHIGVSGTGDMWQDGGHIYADEIIVGEHDGGVGTYTHTGGHVTIRDDLLTLGVNEGSNGTYTWQEGVLLGSDVGDLSLLSGKNGIGSFVQDQRVNIYDRVTLGQESGGNGSFEMKNSSEVTANTITVGAGGFGNYYQYGGSTTVMDLLSLGETAGSNGYYQLEEGALSAAREHIGTYGEAYFKQKGGTNTVTGNMMINDAFFSPLADTYELFDGGKLSVGGDLDLGYHTNGSFLQRDGTVTVEGLFTMSAAAGKQTQYELRNGPLCTSGAYIGWGGEADFYQHNETTFTVHGSLTLGVETGSDGYMSLNNNAQLDIADFLIIGEEGKGYVSQSGDAHNSADVVADTLVIGNSEGSDGTYTINGNEATVAIDKEVIIGNKGKGALSLGAIAGTFDVGSSVTVGKETNGDGTMTINGGDFNSTNHLIVGSNGNGKVIETTNIITAMSPPDVVIGGNLVLGQHVGSNGSYELSSTVIGDGGTVDVTGALIVGKAGTGSFEQSNGTVFANTTMVLGEETGSVGEYNLKGGTVTITDDEIIGQLGKGTFSQSGDGIHHAEQSVILGSLVGSEGTYLLSDGEFILGTDAKRGELIVGDAGKGTFAQSGGTLLADDLHDVLIVGKAAKQASYTLSGGSIDVYNETIGYADGSEGTFQQTSGEHTVHELTIGKELNSTGTYILNGATSKLNTDFALIGDRGAGTVIHDGGTYAIANNLVIGANTDGTGAYGITGGELIVGTSSRPYASALAIGDAEGTGSFTQANGAVSVYGTVSLGTGFGDGEYALLGGYLESTNETIGALGTGTFTQTGGVHAVVETVTVGEEDSLDDNGTYFLNGGNLLAENIKNYGTFTFMGGNISLGDTFLNEGELWIRDGLFMNNFEGNLELNNEAHIVDASVTFDGTVTANAGYISDPSTSTFTDLIVNTNGYLIGGLGDKFNIAGDFENYSTQTGLWNTDQAYLGFVGTDASHNYLLNDTSAQFDWGTLFLEAENSLAISGGFTGDLFFDTIILGGGLDQLAIFSSLNDIYYNSLYDGYGNLLDAITYGLLGGGNLLYASGSGEEPPVNEPVPEPSTLVLSGLALLGLWRRKWARSN